VGVLVTEGRVAVANAALPEAGPGEPANSAPPIFLDAGASVAVARAPSAAAPVAVVPVSAREIGAALAWRRERVEFSRMPLSEVVALFNRRNRVQLAIADRAAATIPISGIFWADDAEGFVRLLESGSVVRAQRSGDTLSLRSR
jgi:transmembrane sensor